MVLLYSAQTNDPLIFKVGIHLPIRKREEAGRANIPPFSCAGVLQGAIDYYILDKYQRLAKAKAYDEVNFACLKWSGEGGGDSCAELHMVFRSIGCKRETWEILNIPILLLHCTLYIS